MYDNICKFLAENYKDDLVTWLLGSPIELTKLSPTELSNEPIRADSLILLQSNQLILHSEFQTDPDKDIPFRMTDYRIRGYRRFPDKEMRQIVVYLRKTDSELVYQNSFRLSKTYHEFEVIRLWEQPTEKFMNLPGLLPFAVLSQTKEPTMVLNEVAKAVETITDQRLQRNIAAASSVLAGLVLDKQVISKIFRSEIMRESVIYQEILEEGRAKGKAENARNVAINLLRIGMSLPQIAQVTELSIEQVEEIQKSIQG
ncbi:Rpn family recombination-promoting nuclease/putative transposase [Sphaerospermopsis sp. LEGE 08334]|jgi:predicted transposase/invertase (TIGR01784 family)|uniref:Rpn family recombination-promoting nuclease/putative transposase n=1 Tax=Sphaerospermopsis sp. LEGE 08334 TaxID=1828651 RepID=UPI0018808721|nr:Rpn family recombination-promoting nuclease/putative transposase [Sphaerospermopsis sp. LEGE 08334]MBE9055121.1 Rpn family recombination-promoting nuclease/putative transposase [Sphaerospermopsis sp. LEGE 08334]